MVAIGQVWTATGVLPDWVGQFQDPPPSTPTKDRHYYMQVGALDRWYVAGLDGAVVLSDVFVDTGVLIAMPLFAPRGGTLDRLAIRVTTVAGAGKKARLGIYAPTSDKDLLPSALVLDAGEVAIDALGMQAASIAQDLTAKGLYWIALTVSEKVRVKDVSPSLAIPILGYPNDLEATYPGIGWVATHAYAALPDPFPLAGLAIITSDGLVAPSPALAVRFSG